MSAPGVSGKTVSAVVPYTRGTAANIAAWDKPCSRVQGKRWRAAISPLQDFHQGALNLPFKQEVIIYS